MYTQEIFITIGVVITLLVVAILRLEMRLRKVLRGNRTKSIDESFDQIETEVKEIKDFKKDVSKYLESVESRLNKSVQGIGTVRFNPFKGTGSGGNQSFATSFITSKGEGVTISTLYSRDHVSVFAKPIKDFKSEFELTGEEKESLEMAKSSTSFEKK